MKKLKLTIKATLLWLLTIGIIILATTVTIAIVNIILLHPTITLVTCVVAFMVYVLISSWISIYHYLKSKEKRK